MLLLSATHSVGLLALPNADCARQQHYTIILCVRDTSEVQGERSYPSGCASSKAGLCEAYTVQYTSGIGWPQRKVLLFVICVCCAHVVMGTTLAIAIAALSTLSIFDRLFSVLSPLALFLNDA